MQLRELEARLEQGATILAATEEEKAALGDVSLQLKVLMPCLYISGLQLSCVSVSYNGILVSSYGPCFCVKP